MVSSSALAFQEQQIETAPAKDAPTATAGPTPKPVELDVPSPAAKSDGTEVTIPGFGKLGVLPKMDFGLELLYGANDAPKVDAEPSDQIPRDDDLTIRGSIKKNF
ncbi:MAG: hypothetical protein ACT4N2_12075 [Hyphomicrobium sp.]